MGKCDVCGKNKFESRKQAKQYIRRRFPKQHMSVYRCGNYYHFGHTPWKIKKGVNKKNRSEM
jgi:hypothetical protein